MNMEVSKVIAIGRRACIALLLALCWGCNPSSVTPEESSGTDTESTTDIPGTTPEEPGVDEEPLQDAVRAEETSLDTVFSDGWVHGNTAHAWSGGTAAFTRNPGATMSFSFTGTRIRWIGWRESGAGIARVWLDGTTVSDVDLYSNTIAVQEPVFTSQTLEPGWHTLTIEATGMANPASTGIKVVVDAFEIENGAPPPAVTRVEETAGALDFTGEWITDNACGTCSGGGDAYSRGPDALVSFSFTGTRVRWLGFRKDAAGIARVWLDGAFAGEVDFYSTTASAQAPVFTSAVLADGPHTLLIEASGMANAAATDTIVAVDAFDIIGEAKTAPAAYRITDLGTLGGAASSAQDINNRGEVVGWSNIANGQRRAFLYREGMLIDLGTLTGGSNSEATSISDDSHIAGFSGHNPFAPPSREVMNGFVWQEGTMENLRALFCPCTPGQRFGISAAYGINNAGQAVGWSETIRGRATIHATLWNYQLPFPGGVNDGEDIGAGSGDWEISRAFGINDLGQAIGDFAPEAGLVGIQERRAFLWKEGVRKDLGRLPGHTSGTALDINRAGVVAGWSGSLDATTARAVLWRDGCIQDLGTLHGATNSQALGINAYGRIVGWSGAPIAIDVSFEAPGWSDAASNPALARAFLRQDGRMLDLNDTMLVDETGAPAPGWMLAEAKSINDAGQIVGTGFHNGQMRAFLLTPVCK